MNKSTIFSLFVMIITISCSTNSNENGITPIEAIQLAAESAPNGINGVFKLKVLETEMVNKIIYLNSQNDYRDQRNISISIPPKIAIMLKQLHGSDPDIYLKGKNIIVNGEAKRIKILFTCDGHQTGKYYYQTQIKITSVDQIKVI